MGGSVPDSCHPRKSGPLEDREEGCLRGSPAFRERILLALSAALCLGLVEAVRGLCTWVPWSETTLPVEAGP